MKLPLPWVLASAAAALMACSSGGGNFGDGGGGSDGGGGGDGGGSSADGGSTATRGGGVYLTSYDYTVANTPVAGGSASASFFASYAGSSSCTTTNEGSCTIYDCSSASADGGSSPPASAGPIHVAGTTPTMDLTPAGSSYAPVTTQAGRLWNGGEQLDVTAQGADVPAFDLKVVAPSYVTVSAPTFISGKVTVVRTQDLAVAWTGGSTGNVTVSFTSTSGSQSTVLSCAFPANAGGGTVPAAALGHLAYPSTSAALAVEVVGRTESNVSGWDVSVVASTLGKTSSGVASGSLVLQ